jgi:hypothetical protein
MLKTFILPGRGDAVFPRSLPVMAPQNRSRRRKLTPAYGDVTDAFGSPRAIKRFQRHLEIRTPLAFGSRQRERCRLTAERRVKTFVLRSIVACTPLDRRVDLGLNAIDQRCARICIGWRRYAEQRKDSKTEFN